LKILFHKIEQSSLQCFLLELHNLYGNLRKSSQEITAADIESIRNRKSLAKTGSSLIKDAYTGVRKWRPLQWWKPETGKVPSHEQYT